MQGSGETAIVCIGCSLERAWFECRVIVTHIGTHCGALGCVLEKVHAIWRNKKITVLNGTTLLDNQIDTLVNRLYGLTDEEIAIVEGND